MRVRFGCLVLVVSCWACAPEAEPTVSAPEGSGQTGKADPEPTGPIKPAVLLDMEPGAAFEALARDLKRPGALALSFQIDAQGALSAQVAGPFARREDGYTEFRANGSFGGNPMSVMCTLGAKKLALQSGDQFEEIAEPAHAADALIDGFLRTGFLHNIAIMQSLKGPEGRENGLDEKFRTKNHRWDGKREVSGTNTQALSFAISTFDPGAKAWQDAGEATIYLSEDTGRPVLREQTVTFSTGAMRVSETYSWSK